MELISVIIPVYDNKTNLERCLDSVIGQKYPDIEIVLVSDGAPDDVYAILNEYYERYTSMVKLVKLPHQGIIQARMSGLREATGEYVTFLDSDDYINRIYLYEMMYLKRYVKTDLVLAKSNYIQNRLVSKASKVYPNEFRISEDKKVLLTVDSSVNGKLFRRDKLKLTDYHLQVNETMSYLYYYLALEDKVGFSNFSKYYVEMGRNTITKRRLENSLGFIEDVIRPLDIMYNLYKSGKLFPKYYSEVEGIFIKNIFLEIDRVKRGCKDLDKQRKLISILIKYLNYRFPDWRYNKYYQRHFVDFGHLMGKLNMVAMTSSGIRPNGKMDCIETIRSFKRVLKA